MRRNRYFAHFVLRDGTTVQVVVRGPRGGPPSWSYLMAAARDLASGLQTTTRSMGTVEPLTETFERAS